MHVSASAIFGLTTREETAAVLRKASECADAWVQDGLKFTPLMALHYTREEFHPSNECNMLMDFEALRFMASLMAAYLVWAEAFEFRTLITDGDATTMEAFLWAAAMVESPSDPFDS